MIAAPIFMGDFMALVDVPCEGNRGVPDNKPPFGSSVKVNDPKNAGPLLGLHKPRSTPC